MSDNLRNRRLRTEPFDDDQPVEIRAGMALLLCNRDECLAFRCPHSGRLALFSSTRSAREFFISADLTEFWHPAPCSEDVLNQTLSRQLAQLKEPMGSQCCSSLYILAVGHQPGLLWKAIRDRL